MCLQCCHCERLQFNVGDDRHRCNRERAGRLLSGALFASPMVVMMLRAEEPLTSDGGGIDLTFPPQTMEKATLALALGRPRSCSASTPRRLHAPHGSMKRLATALAKKPTLIVITSSEPSMKVMRFA